MSRRVRPVTVHAVIPGDTKAVMSYVADTRNDPEWCPNVETAELVSGDGMSAGSVFRYHQHLDTGRGRVEFDGEVTVLERSESSIRWRVTDRFQERDITLSVEPHPKGTRIQQVTRASFLRSPGMVRFIYPFMAKRELTRQFRSLADRFA